MGVTVMGFAERFGHKYIMQKLSAVFCLSILTQSALQTPLFGYGSFKMG